MCTKMPNWGEEYDLPVGVEGFVTLRSYLAGELYYNQKTAKQEVIKFTNVYFKEFIKDNKPIEKIIL